MRERLEKHEYIRQPPRWQVWIPALYSRWVNIPLSAGIETGPAKFVGRISLSAESLGKYSTIGRYGYLPYLVLSLSTRI